MHQAQSQVMMINPQWCPATTSLKHVPFTKENQLLGLTPGNNTTVDYFNLLFDVILMKNIVKHTNENAVKSLCQPGKTKTSRIAREKILTVDEFKILLGLLLHMGTKKLK